MRDDAADDVEQWVNFGASAEADRVLSPTATEPVVSAHAGDAPLRLEIRTDEDENGEFDELVARFADGMVHAEMMSDKSFYVGIYWDDGKQCRWWLGSKKKLWHKHEEYDGEPPKFDAWGRLNRHAQAMEAETGKTEGLDPKDDSAVPQGMRPDLDPEAQYAAYQAYKMKARREVLAEIRSIITDMENE